MPHVRAPMPRNRLIPALVCVLLLALATACVASAVRQPLASGAVRAIRVTAVPQPLDGRDASRQSIGRLRFLGAVALTSEAREFGGISGIIWEPQCQRLLGISDTGAWVILQPAEKDGRLTGIEAAWLAPILDLAGAPADNKKAADAEELARDGNGDVWVFYEQRHRAVRFRGVSACAPQSLGKRPVAERQFAITADWPANNGMEAATAIGSALIAIAEATPAPAGGRQGFIADGGKIARFMWQPPAKGFNPTAMDSYRDATGRLHLIVLHRRFSLLAGVGAAISEAPIAGHQVQLPPTLLAVLTPPYLVDNMEGLAVRNDAGHVQLYLISDNNFNFVQRTILLKFELLPAAE